MNRAAALGLLASSIACTPAEAPAPAGAPAPAAAPAVEPAPEPAPTQPPTEAKPPEPTKEEPPAVSLPEGVELTHGFVIQVATKKELADAKQVRAGFALQQQETSFVLRGPKYWWVMIDGEPPYATFADAEHDLPWIKNIVGEGAIVRQLTEFCPGRRKLEPDVYECVDVPRPDLENPLPEEAAPVPTRPDPVALVHPPATMVMVIATNSVFEPGSYDLDETPKYKTFVWTVANGPLPATGKVPDTIVREHDGLSISDGAELWDLTIVPTAFEYAKCDCDAEETWTVGKGTVRKTHDELIATRRSDNHQVTLIAGTDFPVEGGTVTCLGEASELERDWQLVGVVGPNLFYLNKVNDSAACGWVHGWNIWDARIASLRGTPPTLAAFEAELPGDALGKLRRKAANDLELEAMGAEGEIDADELRPGTIQLLAMFPSYRSGRGGLRLTAQFGVQSMFRHDGGGSWTDGWFTVQATTDYAPSSSLAPPADAMQLMEYVWREHEKWKPIGWSRKL